MNKYKFNLCKELVKTLPRKAQEYFANRFRRSFIEYRHPSGFDSAMEIYRYAFLGEKPPRRFRAIIRPVLVALKMAGGNLDSVEPDFDRDFDAEWNQNRHL